MCIPIVSKNTTNKHKDTIKHVGCAFEGKNIDASGVEWNEEIHSAKRTKTTDGLWRARRHSLNGEEIEDDDEPQSDFQQFMSYIVEHSSELPQEYLMGVLMGFGLTSVVEVQSYPEKIPKIMEVFKAKVNQ